MNNDQRAHSPAQWCRRTALDLSVSLYLSSAAIAWAQTGALEDAERERLEGMATQFVRTEAVPLAAAAAGRLDIESGRLDSRLQLADCRNAEAFLPPGARAWGRTRVGIRCREGAHWIVYLSVDVHVIAPVVVAARPIGANQRLIGEDLRLADIDLTREPPGLSTDLRDLIGRMTNRPIGAGLPIRPEFSRAANVMQAGDPVKVLFQGRGFTIESDGKAVSNAADGEPVRVQVESGRVISGTAHDGRRVEVR